MTTEEKFNAAVNVIRSLPKDGAYQPSDDLKLRFYAYFKQATEGPCNVNKPTFWDVVGRIKWNAWNKLGNMSKHDAMTNYVEELKKIVETMSYNANVETFLGSLGNFHDTVPAEDIEMLLGSVIERVRSQPGSPLQRSPLVSRDTSPKRIPCGYYDRGDESGAGTSPVSFMTPSPQPPDTEDEDEEFIDTEETSPYLTRNAYNSVSNSPVMPRRSAESGAEDAKGARSHVTKENGYLSVGRNGALSNGFARQANGNGVRDADTDEEGAAYASTRTATATTTTTTRILKESPIVARRRASKQNGGPKTGSGYSEESSEPVREAVLQLQKDLDRITARVRGLEAAVLAQGGGGGGGGAGAGAGVESKTSRWPLAEVSPRSAAFIVVWPLVAHFLMLYLNRRK